MEDLSFDDLQIKCLLHALRSEMNRPVDDGVDLYGWLVSFGMEQYFEVLEMSSMNYLDILTSFSASEFMSIGVMDMEHAELIVAEAAKLDGNSPFIYDEKFNIDYAVNELIDKLSPQDVQDAIQEIDDTLQIDSLDPFSLADLDNITADLAGIADDLEFIGLISSRGERDTSTFLPSEETPNNNNPTTFLPVSSSEGLAISSEVPLASSEASEMNITEISATDNSITEISDVSTPINASEPVQTQNEQNPQLTMDISDPVGDSVGTEEASFSNEEGKKTESLTALDSERALDELVIDRGSLIIHGRRITPYVESNKICCLVKKLPGHNDNLPFAVEDTQIDQNMLRLLIYVNLSLAEVFLLCYRLYVPISSIIDSIFDAFQDPAPTGALELDEASIKFARIRIVSLLKLWLKEYPLDFNEETLNQIGSLNESVIETVNPMLSKMITKAITENQNPRIDRSFVFVDSAPEPIIPKKTDFDSFDPLEIARQITLHEQNLY